MSESADNSISSQQRRSNQIKLAILWIIPFALMGVAAIVFNLVQTGQLTIGSKNKGFFIQPPLQLSELLANNPEALIGDEKGNTKSVFSGKWTLVVKGDISCDQSCRDALYVTRQLHIRLNKEADRVQRVYLYSESNDAEKLPLSDELKRFIDEEHRLLKLVPVSADVNDLLDASTRHNNGELANFFIVDPQGWAMMYYLDEHEGSDVLTDIKHLLKFSREG